MGRFKIPVGVMVFVAIWLLALCVPSVRDLPNSLVLMSWFNRYDNGAEPPIVNEMARQAPDDAAGVAWVAENAEQAGDEEALDRAIARFPRDVSLRALRLKLAFRGRVDLEKMRADKTGKETEKWLKFAQFARDDAKLEPDNAFFPWMEAGFLYAARRDDAARAAIERAGMGARYQDYSERTAANRVAFLERHRRVSWSTKISVMSATLYPQLSWIRETSQLATTQALALRKSGDNARASSIEAAILRASFLLRRDAEASISALAGQTIARDSLRTFFGIAKPKNFPPDWLGMRGGKETIDPVPHYRELARTWKNYARDSGKGQWNERAAFVAEVALQNQINDFLGFEDSADLWRLFGLSAFQGTLVYLTPALLFLLFIAMGISALAWLGGSLWRAPNPAPARGQAVACASFSFWALAGAITVVWAIVIRPRDWLLNGGVLDGNATTFGFIALFISTWFLPVLFLSWRHNTALGRVPEAERASGWKRWAPFVLWLVTGVGIAAVASNASSGTPLLGDPMLNVTVVLSTLGAMAASWRNGGARSRWKWHLAHRSLGVLLVAWSAMFLLSALVLWPLQNQLSDAIGRRIQIGEIAWMRQQSAKQ